MIRCASITALVILAMGSLVGVAQGQAGYAPPSPAAAEAADAKFAAFIHDFRTDAVAQGISPATYDRAMSHVTRNPGVEGLNAEQPEFTRPVWDYLDSMVSDRRVNDGHIRLLEYAPLFASIEMKFGVPKELLAAIWGDESNYGEAMGSFGMFEALATLAYDGPRKDYARHELIAAFKMMDKQHYDPAQMTSSWAGAFGQMQFVPSSFLLHAVDGDGDGRIDLWNSPGDALASAAQLLDDYGWQRGGRCAYEIQLPQGFDYSVADLETQKTPAQWNALGVRTISGTPLADAGEPGAIYLPAGARGPAFLVFGNFRVVLKYNNAASYALAVCTLADRLRGEGRIAANWPRDEAPLLPDERLTFQSTLKSLGYDPGVVDGILGRGTRAALRAWQKAHGFAADGFPTKALLATLMEEAARSRH